MLSMPGFFKPCSVETKSSQELDGGFSRSLKAQVNNHTDHGSQLGVVGSLCVCVKVCLSLGLLVSVCV